MVKKINKYLYIFLESFGGLITAVVFLLLLAQVIFRYANITVPWTENIARAFLIWLTFIGAAVVQWDKDHIRAEFVPEFFQKLNERFYWVYEIIVNLFTIAFLAVGLRGAIDMYKTMDYIGLAAVPSFKVAYLYLSQVIGLSAMIIFILLETVDYLKSVFTHSK